MRSHWKLEGWWAKRSRGHRALRIFCTPTHPGPNWSTHSPMTDRMLWVTARSVLALFSWYSRDEADFGCAQRMELMIPNHALFVTYSTIFTVHHLQILSALFLQHTVYSEASIMEENESGVHYSKTAANGDSSLTFHCRVNYWLWKEAAADSLRCSHTHQQGPLHQLLHFGNPKWPNTCWGVATICYYLIKCIHRLWENAIK